MEEARDRTERKTEDLEKGGGGYNINEMWECVWNELKKNDKKVMKFLDGKVIRKPLNPRDAFFGGRTNAVKLYHKCGPNEKIRYVDFCSLYPYVNKKGTYPVGHPKIVKEVSVEDFPDIFGFLKCLVLPPESLLHPVLPDKVNGKLMFHLCQRCATDGDRYCTHSDTERAFWGTWTHLELAKAIEKGYKILEICEAWHFETNCQETPDQEGLFSKYINTMLKLKAEASGFSNWCKTEDDCIDYIKSYFDAEGIWLDFDSIKRNPGKRALFKLMLNSFWGKFGQRANLPQTSFITTCVDFFTLMTNNTKDVSNVIFLDEATAMVTYADKEEWVMGGGQNNVFIAAFTTSQARLKLYDLLDLLGARVLYFDTDSVLYVDREDDKVDVPLCDFLGDLTNELEVYDEDAWICEFVSGGPKNYGYRITLGIGILDEVCKVRGITLNFSAAEIVNFDTIKKQID